MRIVLLFLVILIGLMGYVRLAPTRLDARHKAAVPTEVGDLQSTGGFQAARKIIAPTVDVLQAVEQRALATLRTRVIAGSVEDGTITFETRSALWGFPDYTTASVQGDLLVIAGHLRFGRSDMGVNKTRILGWITTLAPLTEPL
ncbi:DUF1499 domain-containing protein [Loktanella sp. D2R18]|uniref:DUF1499 domain-containing protein n=1 Tax=Rhodobacterales TaxID=204455 RepID=UPI000DEA1DA1|nr:MULTISPECIES: DUF1499 domain-containing protein [Rhodobacterales]MDO6589632.1 DUF1499 domain-containing protein [Yoonia sp. 1_MG-2023]RBW44267.1 DUF1499 domain-containing protein [Loktanella sp. D2R18]